MTARTHSLLQAVPTVTPQLTTGERTRRRIKTFGLRMLAKSRLTRLIGYRYGGSGIILMFHHFTRNTRAHLDQGCLIDDFGRILAGLKQRGRQVVTLDEATRRIAQNDPRPFAVLTFDDGYRSNIDLALPLLEKYAAPATIYVPTEMMTRTINAWWLGLTELFRSRERIEIEPMGQRFTCPDTDSKIAGLRRAVAWVWEDFHRAEMLSPTFTAHGICVADIVARYTLDDAGVKAADRHPLIEIGAHTTTHRALALLDEDQLRADIADNKAYLEALLGREVPHFAYPYGPPSLSGEREPRVVREAGFRTAVTTTPGCLFPAHADHMFTLPRQNAEFTADSASYTECGIDGLFRALATRGGNPLAGVTAPAA
ncbi:polysaccharide deacetylase family protein [Stappia sp. WLB 29]|uniref:polysaccharide deacetylase family protein n=1 Tax=Stappia sp. WLB 29 TaxID=2925220 RepID=UPI0020C0C75A|nr:polysaccharide deacetylase family protein [Stappia sp. WLB 29]